ncbi:MAG: 16S rRNA (guanine(966)-N(2))-methyltransferase RsmD [Burkholderiaceae bacterium]|nr:MAG: 16S rRNA (guanine(966)-N(2))-methyltransferase RsmD [Burkholderiaceae bacterium]
MTGGGVKRSAPPQQIRIIGGQWKRTPVRVPDVPGLRPTPDRVRETLFNWLGQDLSGWRCLDLFGGTGALGLEAASRGASSVLINEKNPQAARTIAALIAKLQAAQVTLLQNDAPVLLQQLQQRGERFDLIFLDPPFGAGWLEKVFPQLDSVLQPQGCVYVEAEAPLDPGLLAGKYVVHKQDKAGAVHYHLLHRITGTLGTPS